MIRHSLRTAFGATLIAVSVAPVAVRAQAAAPILGSWTIDWESGRRIENDNVQVIRSTGTMAIATSGDSLLATVTPVSRSDGSPAPKPFTISGRVTAAGAMFKQSSEMRMNMNGEERTQTVTATWTLSADGDQLNGTIARELPGMPVAPEPAVLSGKRIK